jgi:hypothetical protein
MIYARPGSPFARPVPELDPNAEPPARKVGPARPPANDHKAIAAAIILAGKKRRNEVAEDTRPPIGTLGRAILDAAKKARGEA